MVNYKSGLLLKGFYLLALFTFGAVAQVSPLENRRIAEIQFSPPQTLDPADLGKHQPLRPGQPLRAEDVANAIDSLFATGRFQDISVEAEPSGDGVIIRFVTQNTLFVGGVSVQGKVAIPPNRGQIASTAQLDLGAPFREEDLNQAVDAIKKILESNGLYEAQVTPKVEREESAQQVFITFQLKENRRAKYEKPIIQGESGLSDDTILRATGWRIPIIHWWRQTTDARTRNGVQGLLSKLQGQGRLTAKVDLQKLDYDAQSRRVRPNLNVNRGPKVKVQSIEAKVSQRVLKRYVPVFSERAVDNDLLVEGQRNLRDYFQSQGYYDVDVTFRTEPLQNDSETIDYVISQGQRYKLVKVSISGNKYFHSEDIRERMFMQPSSFNLRHGRYSEAFRKKDEENITNLYLANGFRDAKVTSIVDRDYKSNSGQIAVTVTIIEGNQWLVDTISVNGITQVNKDELTSRLTSITGEPFAEVNMASDRNEVLTYYYARGFPDATFEAKWALSGTPNRVNVVYTVTEGNRSYVRDVITTGLRTTRKSLVDKNITLKAGDPLSPIQETDIQKKFYDLGIFARVDTAIQNPDGDTDHKYVLYNFEEANRYNVALGVGAQVARFGTPSSSSLSSPGGATGFSPIFSLDVSRLNFLGTGQTVTLRGLYSSLEKRGSLTYLVPRFMNVDGRQVTYTILWDNSLNVRTFASKREEGSVQLSQKFSKSLTGLFRFSYRRVSVSSVIIPVLLVPQLLQPVRLGILGANIAQDRRDNPADPHRGIFNTADIGVAGKFFGGQRSFARILLRNATYYRLTNTLVLARQTQFGVIVPFAAPAGLTDQQSVPLPERFFGGGADSLRAFPFNQAGPRDTGAPQVIGGPTSEPTGFPLGGNALFFNNIELRFPFLLTNLQGVVFHDMGNVFSTLGNISFHFHQKNLQDFDYTVHAAGFGVRYRTPVGPIRLDLAYSINPPSYIGFSGTPVQLLQCNPNLPPQGVCVGTKQNVSHFQFFFSIGQTF
jgi:outer membrane protein assembly complex protein YaeT